MHLSIKVNRGILNNANMSLKIKISGKVTHGEEVGRTIGFPTANLDIKIDPNELKMGIYFGECKVKSKTYYCLAYFGPRHIFGEPHNNFEVYLYDFKGDLYGEELTITLTQFMRKPVKTKSLEELKKLIEEDKEAGEKLFTKPSTSKKS